MQASRGRGRKAYQLAAARGTEDLGAGEGDDERSATAIPSASPTRNPILL
jgi:hypothetical protein